MGREKPKKEQANRGFSGGLGALNTITKFADGREDYLRKKITRKGSTRHESAFGQIAAITGSLEVENDRRDQVKALHRMSQV